MNILRMDISPTVLPGDWTRARGFLTEHGNHFTTEIKIIVKKREQEEEDDKEEEEDTRLSH